MKIEKGKLYYNTQEGVLEMPMSDMEVDEGVLTDKIAVHCPTKEDFEFIRNILGDVNQNRPYVFINEEYGLYRDYNNYHIITIDQFKQFYPKTEMTPTHFAISPEDYKEWQEYKNSKEVVEFKYSLNGDKTFSISELSPNDFKNIDLICKNYTSDNLDLMFAYDKDISKGLLYLGHYNSGNVK